MNWWSWCEERAGGGWAVLMIVTVLLVVGLAIYVTRQSEAVLAECQAPRP